MESKIFRVVIIDDDKTAIDYLMSLIDDLKALKLMGSTTNPRKALSLCLESNPDIIFLDVEMPVMDGFQVLREIHYHQLNPYVIFTTGFDKYAIQAIKEGTFDYLLKPVDPDELSICLKRVLNDHAAHNLEHRMQSLEKAMRNHQKLSFFTRSGIILIHPDDIFYVEASASYSDIYISKEKREVISMNIGAVKDLLPPQFIQISRSLIINSNYLEKLISSKKHYKCFLKKENEETSFPVPEKNLPELRRMIKGS
ncbi:MAG: LytTR family DNA-binding domain-containing protein [Bacteroidota bacterium]